MKRLISIFLVLSLAQLFFVNANALNSNYEYSMLGLDEYADYLRGND